MKDEPGKLQDGTDLHQQTHFWWVVLWLFIIRIIKVSKTHAGGPLRVSKLAKLQPSVSLSY